MGGIEESPFSTCSNCFRFLVKNRLEKCCEESTVVVYQVYNMGQEILRLDLWLDGSFAFSRDTRYLIEPICRLLAAEMVFEPKFERMDHHF